MKEAACLGERSAETRPPSYLLYYDLPCGLRPHTIVVEVLTRGIECERELLSRQKHATVELVLKERIRTMIIRAARWVDERHRRSDRNHQVLRIHRIRAGCRFGAGGGCSAQEDCVCNSAAVNGCRSDRLPYRRRNRCNGRGHRATYLE